MGVMGQNIMTVQHIHSAIRPMSLLVLHRQRFPILSIMRIFLGECMILETAVDRLSSSQTPVMLYVFHYLSINLTLRVRPLCPAGNPLGGRRRLHILRVACLRCSSHRDFLRSSLQGAAMRPVVPSAPCQTTRKMHTRRRPTTVSRMIDVRETELSWLA